MMPCGTLLFQPTRIPCTAIGSKLPRRTVGCSGLIANARQTQGGHELGFSFGNKSHYHIQLDLRKHAVPTRSDPPRRSVQVSAVCRGYRLSLRVLLHQATEIQVRLFDARDILYHVFEHQHCVRQAWSRWDHRRRLWCEGQHVSSTSCRLRP